MSDYELLELNKRVALSGRQKQDFIIRSILHQKIVVIGNQVQYENLKIVLEEIIAELRRIERAEDVDDEWLAPIRTAVEIVEGFSSSEDIAK
jgi:hypothetical protein